MTRPRGYDGKRLLVLLVVALLAVGLWDTPVLYPLKIFVVFLH